MSDEKCSKELKNIIIEFASDGEITDDERNYIISEAKKEDADIKYVNLLIENEVKKISKKLKNDTKPIETETTNVKQTETEKETLSENKNIKEPSPYNKNIENNTPKEDNLEHNDDKKKDKKKNKKGVIIFFILLAILVILILIIKNSIKTDTQKNDFMNNFSGNVTEIEIKQAINNTPILYTLEATSQVAVTSKDERGITLGGFKNLFGNRQCVMLISANIKTGIDLSEISDITINGNSISLTLPEPFIKIESSKIDKIISDNGFWRDEYSGSEQEEIMKEGYNRIKDNLDKLDLIEPTIEEAKIILKSILKKFGFQDTNINIYIKKHKYTKDSLKKLIIE